MVGKSQFNSRLHHIADLFLTLFHLVVETWKELNEKSIYVLDSHPIYTCMLLITWLFPFMSWNVLAIALGVTGYNILGAQLEERKLLLEFGGGYRVYSHKTPFMIPGLKFYK